MEVFKKACDIYKNNYEALSNPATQNLDDAPF